MNLITSKTPKNSVLVPVVVEKEAGYERSYDIYSRLLKDFIVFVSGPIEMETANTFIAQLLFLQSVDDKRDISIYINSPGGVAYAGRAMYDTMKHIKNPIVTINVGLAASAAALILCGGSKGKRFALPGSYTMIHQTLGGIEGQATEVQITANHMIKLREEYAAIIAENSGQKLEKVLEDIERDKWLDATQSKEYGLIDDIMKSQK